MVKKVSVTKHWYIDNKGWFWPFVVKKVLPSRKIVVLLHPLSTEESIEF
jgi:hypothetical protein